ncbi:MAG: RNA methyltransferase [Cyanothece sp. SIO1E1]|nr:RNA methyltransferase [Cyanothece sp. SIO1E1]
MLETLLSHIRIVLVEPAGPLNVGAVARVMKNMGLQQLVLVKPKCDSLGVEAQQMAVHAVDLLEAAQSVMTLPEALQGCQRAIATTARPRALVTQLETPESGLPWLLPQGHEIDSLTCQSALIFGPEERGLSNTELNYAQRFVRIPTASTYPSLNLAQAVSVCCYVLHCQAQMQLPQIVSSSVSASEPVQLSDQSDQTVSSGASQSTASLEILERYYQHLETVLLKIGYLHPHTAASRMEKFRRLFNRAFLSEPEVAMLRGILRQVEWAIYGNKSVELPVIDPSFSSDQGSD